MFNSIFGRSTVSGIVEYTPHLSDPVNINYNDEISNQYNINNITRVIDHNYLSRSEKAGVDNFRGFYNRKYDNEIILKIQDEIYYEKAIYYEGYLHTQNEKVFFGNKTLQQFILDQYIFDTQTIVADNFDIYISPFYKLRVVGGRKSKRINRKSK